MNATVTVIAYGLGTEQAVEGDSVLLTLGVNGPVIGQVNHIRKCGKTVVGNVVVFEGHLKSLTDQSVDLFSLKSCSIMGSDV